MSSHRRRERYPQRTVDTDDLVFEAFDPYSPPMRISVVNDPLEDDEAVARALQEEYEAEYRRSQYAMQQGRSNNNSSNMRTGVVPSAPLEPPAHRDQSQASGSRQNRSSNRQSKGDFILGESARRTERRSSSSRMRDASPRTQHERPRSHSRSRSTRQALSDEEYARRLDREMRQSSRDPQGYRPQRSPSNGRSMQQISDEEYARRLEREMSAPAIISSNGTALLLRTSQTPGTSRFNGEDDFAVEVAIMTADDESYARRVEQELADERLAESIRRQEQQRIDTQHALALQQQRKSRKCWCTVLPLLLIIGAVGGVLYFFMFGDEGLPNWMPSPEEFAEEDPFSQKGPGEVNKWRTGNSGLELEVLNALEDMWFPFFYTAVAEWDAGNPDAVNLQTTRVDPDADCRSVAGVLKVCNGNYGETSWRGINKLLLENGDIYASAARMNEFYFKGEDADQRQYTMCHEIGHGLGLPHTDESFTNKDLGNCMDYTNRPDVNKQPDRSNFIFLAELYGTVPGSPPYIPEPNENIDIEAQAQVEPALETLAPSGNDTYQDDEDDDEDRRLRGNRYSSRRLLNLFDEVDQEIERGHFALGSQKNSWKLLHRSEYGEAHEKKLDDRFTIQVHFLLA